MSPLECCTVYLVSYDRETPFLAYSCKQFQSTIQAPYDAAGFLYNDHYMALFHDRQECGKTQ